MPAGAKPVPRSPLPGSQHSLGVGAGHGKVFHPAQPRTAMGGPHLYKFRNGKICPPCQKSGLQLPQGRNQGD